MLQLPHKDDAFMAMKIKNTKKLRKQNEEKAQKQKAKMLSPGHSSDDDDVVSPAGGRGLKR